MKKPTPTNSAAFYTENSNVFINYNYAFSTASSEKEKKKLALEFFNSIYAFVDYVIDEEYEKKIKTMLFRYISSRKPHVDIEGTLPFMKHMGMTAAEEKEMETVLALLNKAKQRDPAFPMELDYTAVATNFTDKRRQSLIRFLSRFSNASKEYFQP